MDKLYHDPAQKKQTQNQSSSSTGFGKTEDSSNEINGNENSDVVNSGAQNEIVNEQDTNTAGAKKSDEKAKGYQEGTRNDSLTEPGSDDSDGQLQFPEDETVI